MAAPMRNAARSLLSGNLLDFLSCSRSKVQPSIKLACNSLRHMHNGSFRAKYFTQNRILLRNTCLFTAGVGLTAYAVDLWRRALPHVHAEQGGAPKFKVARSIKSETDSTGLKLTLYQYQTCPFCCKTRAYLDYHGFSYDVIEVNSVWRTQIKWSKYRKVPILVIDGVGEDGFLQINDSSVIMSLLESFLEDRSQGLDKLASFYPVLENKNKKGKTVFEFPNKYFVMYQDKKVHTSSPEQRQEERKWRLWTDDVLVHVLSPNIYRTPAEAVRSFQYFSKAGDWENNFATWERLCIIYVGAAAMYLVGKMLKKKYNLQSDVRQSLYESCHEWTKALGKGRSFMGGAHPNLADLSVYGVLSAIEGCPAFKDLLQHSDISAWYYRVKAVTQSGAGSHPLVAKK